MLIRILSVVLGAALVATVLLSALQTVVLPKGGLTGITRFMFAVADRLFIRRHGLPARFGWSGLYAPVSLVLLPLAWASLVTLGFGFVFWGFQEGAFADSVAVSGSSLFTLGFLKPDQNSLVLLTFLEALIGLGLVALLISFLPTLYSAYSDREKGVGLMGPLFGVEPSAIELIRRTHAGQAMSSPTIWGPVSSWFAELEQSHTAFPSLSSFPPQVPDRSWVVAAGTILDATSLLVALLPAGDVDRSPEFTLVLAHGTSATSRVAGAAGLPVEPSRAPTDVLSDTTSHATITISRAEFDEAVEVMRSAGVRVRPDVDEGWRIFALLRSGYEDAILGLAGFTHAPAARWTSDRRYTVGRPRFFGQRPLSVVRSSAPSDG
jgi:hypothetical protein